MRVQLLIGLAICAGCAGTPFPESTPIESEEVRIFLHGRLVEYQSQPRVVERATMTLGGEEYALTLYAACEDGERLRLAAVSDLGTTLFGVEVGPRGVEVLQTTEGFPDRVLKRIALDQAVALVPPLRGEVRPVRLADGQTAVAYGHFGCEVLACVAEGEGRLRLWRGRDGELRSTLVLGGARVLEVLEVDAADGSYAARIDVEPWGS